MGPALVQHASSLSSSGRACGPSLPLAELLIVVTGFFATVCLDGAMEVTERVLLHDYSVASALHRMRGELGIERLTRGYIAEEPILTANTSWSDVRWVGQSRTGPPRGSR